MDKGASVVRTVRLLRVMIGLVPLLWVPVGLGQTTSITSSGLNTHVSHTTGQQNYDITGGTRPDNGTNLFHSFGNFSVGTQDVARFVNDAHLPTTNILSRVTGGNPSNIFGEINTTNFPGANLYLINPAGVLFGATATLNVSGSVHVSTADYLRLADGLRFNAIPGPQDTLLSQAPVVAFGFLHAHPRPITVHGSRLSVGEGKVLSLVGGDIRITDGTLTASSGQINLVSLAGKGEARVAPDGIAIAGMTPRGQIVIKERFPRENHAPVAGLDTSGNEGGAVVIRGGRLSLTGAEVIADARVANHTGRGIVIEATDSATMDNVSLRTSAFGVPNPNTGGGAGPISVTAPSMTASNSSISTSSGNNGPAGDVAINVGSLTASNLQIETGIGSGNRPAPASGNISIRATGDVTLQNSGISTGTFGLRDAGHITVRAATLALTEGSSISSGAQFDGSSGGGRAGNIAIDVGHLTMRTSSINTSILTSTLTSGRGGNISVKATDRVILDQGFISTTIAGSGKGWKGGSITLSTPRLTLDHFGAIGTSASPLLASPPGDLRAGDISVHVGTLNMFNGGAITSGTCCDFFGNSAGNINIVASRSISMAGVFSPDASPTEISSTTSSAGQAGRVHIVAPTMILNGRAVVSASSQSTGPAGSVVLDVNNLHALRGARIESTGTGVAGTIVINAARNITTDNGTITAAGAGHSGTVNLYAGKSIQLRNGSLISADDTAIGDAGRIVIQAGKSFVSRDSSVSAQAQQGNGGAIDVHAKNVTLTNSRLTTAVSGSPETVGGHVTVNARNLTLRNSQILSTATEGDGGTISIRSHALHRDTRSVIDASSESGTDGMVIIQHE